MSSFIRSCRYVAVVIVPFVVLAFVFAVYETPQLAQNIKNGPEATLNAKFKGSDTATRAIRNESKVISRVSVENAADREKARRLGTIVQDYGSFVVLAHDKQLEAKNYGLEEQVLETSINLPGGQFDPLQASAGRLSPIRGSSDGKWTGLLHRPVRWKPDRRMAQKHHERRRRGSPIRAASSVFRLWRFRSDSSDSRPFACPVDRPLPARTKVVRYVEAAA